MSSDLSLPFIVPVFSLVGFFAAWLYYQTRVSWPKKSMAEDRLYRCTTCQHVYVESRDVPMARCPKCDRFNEAVRR